MDYRQYDNALGRFNCIDLLAEKNSYQSTYQFSNNNPIFFSDPTGLDSSIESIIATMWNETPEGTNSHWVNIGGGGGGSSFGCTSGGNGLAGSWVSGDGTFHASGSTGGTNGAYTWHEGYTIPNGNFSAGILDEFVAGRWVKNKSQIGQNIQEKGPSGFDLANGFVGNYLFALDNYSTANSTKIYNYGTRAISAVALTEANAARMLNIAKGAQVLGNTIGFVSGGVSLYNAYSEYQTTGNVNYQTVIDGSISIAGASAGTAMMFGVLASNPVGWAILGTIATGAAIYGVYSFGRDVYNASNH